MQDWDAPLTGAAIASTHLSGATLAGADLTGADLQGAIALHQGDLTGARYDQATVFPSGFAPAAAGLIASDAA